MTSDKAWDESSSLLVLVELVGRQWNWSFVGSEWRFGSNPLCIFTSAVFLYRIQDDNRTWLQRWLHASVACYDTKRQLTWLLGLDCTCLLCLTCSLATHVLCF